MPNDRVRISRDGTIQRGGLPFGLDFLINLFWGSVDFVAQFFRTLINPAGDSQNTGGRGGRGNGPGGPGGGRRGFASGGFKTIQDCSMPGGG